MTAALRRSPLHEVHAEAGAKLVDFGGWEMPLSYRSGTVAEHMACRRGAAMFDVSHLGTVRVQGPGAHRSLQQALTNDLDRIAPGGAQYTHLLDHADASVLDDIIVWWVDDDRFDVMPNASNTQRVVSALQGGDGGVACVVQDEPLYGTGSATSVLTVLMVLVLLIPVLVRTWRDFRR